MCLLIQLFIPYFHILVKTFHYITLHNVYFTYTFHRNKVPDFQFIIVWTWNHSEFKYIYLASSMIMFPFLTCSIAINLIIISSWKSFFLGLDARFILNTYYQIIYYFKSIFTAYYQMFHFIKYFDSLKIENWRFNCFYLILRLIEDLDESKASFFIATK